MRLPESACKTSMWVAASCREEPSHLDAIRGQAKGCGEGGLSRITQGGQAVAVAREKRDQFASAPVAGNKALWVGEAAEEPPR